MASKLRTLQTVDLGFLVVVTVVVGLPEIKDNEMMHVNVVTVGQQGSGDFVLVTYSYSWTTLLPREILDLLLSLG